MDPLEFFRDPIIGARDVERRRPHITVVGDADGLVDGDVVDRMVQAHLARVVPDRPRRQPGAHPVARARIERDPDEDHIQAAGIGDVRVAHERGDSRVPRVHHAVDGPGLLHGVLLSSAYHRARSTMARRMRSTLGRYAASRDGA